MDIDDTKAMARRSLEMWAGDASVDAAAVFAEDYVNHQEPLADGGVASIGRDEWATVVEANHRAFPDLTVEILRQVAETDTVATHWRFSATQQGPYEGRDATGRTVSWTGVQIDRFVAGSIAESWVVWDKYTQFSALAMIGEDRHSDD